MEISDNSTQVPKIAEHGMPHRQLLAQRGVYV